MTKISFSAVRARQAPGSHVLAFAAKPSDVMRIAAIDRVGRSEDGTLRGFQRHQIASHIKEIRDYFSREDALLPNAVIVAFIEGQGVTISGGSHPTITVDLSGDRPGFVVDGQQRLTALDGLNKPDFEIFVSALVCKDYNQLRQQFVLINNTRPLPKTLIYELLPNVVGLPERFSSRTLAARLVDRLNFTAGSSLFHEIRQHTNPTGILSDIAMQRFVMHSTSDGALRALIKEGDLENRAYSLISEYFAAIKEVFGPEWIGMTPRTSRLRHGAGLVAMGFVMELLFSTRKARLKRHFVPALERLKKHTAWTSGTWRFSENDIRPWNGIQNTSTDIDLLSNYLVRTLKRSLSHT